MAKLIVKSPYIKSGGKGGAGGYLSYIATRERVQKLADDRPPTANQKQIIGRLTKDFPEMRDLFEYEDYLKQPNKVNASAFITLALESNWQEANQSEIYMKYIATRPRVERLGKHGLFGDADYVDLDAAMNEIESYNGNVWTHIYSLRREDAARLGYDDAQTWRNLLRTHRNDIAAAMKIPPNDFRWYAAFHDEGEHPHVHMMAWSAKPGQAYLSREGIRQIKSTLTNDIFKQEMLHIYGQKSATRNELVQEARLAMLDLVQEMRQGICDLPEAEPLIMELVQGLESHKGKKSYSYLSRHMKGLVDEIVGQIEQLPVVAECYERWLELQGQVEGYYSGATPKRKKLSEQKEFRAIKNAVIKEAEHIRMDVLTFEDGDLAQRDEPEDELRAPNRFWYMVSRIYDIELPLAERDAAVEMLRGWAEGGDGNVQYFLGKLYRDDGLLIPDDIEAARWFDQAARQGIVLAQYALGKQYLSDDLEVYNPKLGMAWLEYAAQNGNHNAAYRAGKEYLRGEIVAKDVRKAVSYFNSAAMDGNQYAAYMLGKMCLTGQEVKQNHELAMWLLDQSAYQGHQYAQYFLDRQAQLRPPSVMLAATRLLYHLSCIFQDNSLPQTTPGLYRIDRKRLAQLMEKRQAMGMKGAPTAEEGPTMFMR